jgi:ADP-ribose pyrophosphatase YjhB (NUDIX family)
MENLDSIRAGGICVFNNKILLIHRINLEMSEEAREYYVIPGGEVMNGEKTEDAVLREMKEETDVNVMLGELFFEMDDKNPRGGNRKHYYYICEYIEGEPKLRSDSEEAREMKEGVHFYTPMWVDLSEFERLSLFPDQIKDKIITKFIRNE